MRLRSADVELRAFEPGLTDALYGIRNHPSVRCHLRMTQPLARADHERWVKENLLGDRRVHLFVVFAGSGPVGLALLRNFAGQQAEVGLMMVEARRRRRVAYKAAHLIGCYGFEVLGLERVLSYVPRHNHHALAFNLGCGFERTGADSVPYFELALTAERWRTHAVHRRFRARYPMVLA
jgi:RimJ/RimL family protein N-acetyltransferase